MGPAVEATGETVEAATLRALARLGAAPAEVEVVVIDAGRRGLLRRPARVRVTVRDAGPHPTPPPAASPEQQPSDVTAPDEALFVPEPADAPDGAAEKHVSDRPAGPAPTDDGVPLDSSNEMSPQSDPPEEETVSETDTTATEVNEDELSPEERMDLIDEEADLAADFVEGLLDHLDLPGDIEIEVQEEQAIVNVSEVGSGLLIGRRGATLDALQELVRCAVQRQTERRSHVRVDVEGYRERQIDKLRDKCRDAIAEARETGEPVRLEPMDAYERKMMHDLVSRTGGVTTTSEGAEPKRRVVIHPE